MIALVHGWGYDATIWDAVRAELGDLPLLTLDLGFFGDPRLPPLPAHCLGVGHSLGFLWLLRNAISNCGGLVAVNGFPRFSETEDFKAGVPQRVLQRMGRRLDTAPYELLDEFHHTAGAAGTTTVADSARLKTGLDWLAEWDGRAALRDFDGRLAILAAPDDGIVAEAMTRQAFAGREITWHSGGHMLPTSAPRWVAGKIRNAWLALAA